jgi:hypothetical protein
MPRHRSLTSTLYQAGGLRNHLRPGLSRRLRFLAAPTS